MQQILNGSRVSVEYLYSTFECIDRCDSPEYETFRPGQTGQCGGVVLSMVCLFSTRVRTIGCGGRGSHATALIPLCLTTGGPKHHPFPSFTAHLSMVAFLTISIRIFICKYIDPRVSYLRLQSLLCCNNCFAVSYINRQFV